MIWLPLLALGVGVGVAVAVAGRGDYFVIRTPADFERFGKQQGSRMERPTNRPVFVVVVNTGAFELFDGVGRELTSSGRTVVEIHASAIGLSEFELEGEPDLAIVGLVNGATPAKARFFTSAMPPGVSSSRIVAAANAFAEFATAPGMYLGNEGLVGPIEGIDVFGELLPPMDFGGAPPALTHRHLLDHVGVPK